MMEEIYWDKIAFNNQWMFIAATKQGLKFLSDPGKGLSQIYDFYPQGEFEFIHVTAKTTLYHHFLTTYLGGDRPHITVPLDFKAAGTSLDRKIWHSIQKIPYGEVCALGKFCQKYQFTPAQVQSALQANPLPILIPAHRIIPNPTAALKFRGTTTFRDQLLEIEAIQRNLEG